MTSVLRSDVAIAGGGLSGGLIALALQRRNPGISVTLIEGGEQIGGNHRWSWFASDISPQDHDLMKEFPHKSWRVRYEVRFPQYRRHLATSYNSLYSTEFAQTLENRLNQRSILTTRQVASLDRNSISLADGDRVEADVVIDCRGITNAPQLSGGWQVFLGQTWKTDVPHNVVEPVIMDVEVAQKDGYRFVYVLPLDEHRVFVEDTYYNDAPTLDIEALRGRIAQYVSEQGWSGEVEDEETGVLPVITGGDFAAFQAAHRIEGVAMAGARGGFVHPLTSYTLPKAVEIAHLVADEIAIGRGPVLAATLEKAAQDHWRATGFYRMLGKMLFGAARPEERYRVFEHFYRLPEDLVERFYACQSTYADKARILIGKPPVPVGRAIRTLATSRTEPLSKETAA
ncbi:lycopene beta-cyclase CrtY [Altererythrobacter aurantiacus]|uniref:Lycopene beta-cyclase CrtY n=1 Tax=Parapontixanthobacter aurantiacus TaxID=1463599 RepID=A0A844ZIQ8_9SPHN|nr:lycopene beta-cyclase CrtY [Parapontixanthobacter aurantiacus]